MEQKRIILNNHLDYIQGNDNYINVGNNRYQLIERGLMMLQVLNWWIKDSVILRIIVLGW